METRIQEIAARGNRNVKIGVIPGHFATNHSHVNYCVDMTRIKSFHRMAKSAAAELAKPYLTTTPIDTIICLEGTEMIGAFLANELAQPGTCILNGGNDISVITPETNANNQMIFRDNTQKMVWGKNILLLLSSVSTGKTINRSLECLRYYSGGWWESPRFSAPLGNPMASRSTRSLQKRICPITRQAFPRNARCAKADKRSMPSSTATAIRKFESHPLSPDPRIPGLFPCRREARQPIPTGTPVPERAYTDKG